MQVLQCLVNGRHCIKHSDSCTHKRLTDLKQALLYCCRVCELQLSTVCGGCRELQDMRASLMALDKIYHRHAIMPGAVRSSPAFDNATRALQRLTLDNEAAAAVATADWQAMEQVLEEARKQNNQVVAHRMEV